MGLSINIDGQNVHYKDEYNYSYSSFYKVMYVACVLYTNSCTFHVYICSTLIDLCVQVRCLCVQCTCNVIIIPHHEQASIALQIRSMAMPREKVPGERE